MILRSSQQALARLPGSSQVGRANLPTRVGAGLRRVTRRISRRDLFSGLDDESIGRRAVVAVVGCFLGTRLLPGTPIGKPMLGAALAVFIAARLEKRDRNRSDEIAMSMPDVLDRMAVCALAGRSIEQSLRIVTSKVSGRIGERLRTAVAILDAGGSRGEALDHLVIGPDGEAWAAPVAAMERAERLGVPVSDVLVSQAREQRNQVRMILESQARTAPVKIVFPLVFCFLPAFLVLAVGPIALSAIRTLASI